jgi:hypothetical protein
MAYRGERVGIGEMFDALLARSRTRHEAAVELHHALSDGRIVLWYGGQPVVDDIPTIGRVLRDFATDPRHVERGLGNIKIVMAEALASRDQFEAACDLVEATEPEKSKPKGPVPGSINRYGESDRARFPEIEALVQSGKSLTAACSEIGLSLEGPGTPESKATRLRRFYQSIRSSH